MDSELRKLDNVAMTPHNAFYTQEAVKRLTDICMGNIKNYFNGSPANVVSQ